MSNVRLPGLLDASLSETARLHPTGGSLTLKMFGTSEGTFTLPDTDELTVHIHDWISVYTDQGFEGIYRVSNIGHPLKKQRDLTILHGIDILADSVWAEQTDFSGTTTQFLTALLNQQTHLIGGVKPWALGTCEDTSTVKRSINYDRLSTLLEGLVEEGGDFAFVYDQSSFPWTMSLVAVSQTVSSEFRLLRNIRSATVTYNDADMCNRLIVSANVTTTTTQNNETTESTETTIKTYNNTTAQSTYGIIVKTADIDVSSIAEADAWAAAFLAKRAEPSVQIQLEAADYFDLTGEPLDKASLGKLCRIALPAYGKTFTERAVTLTYPNLFKGKFDPSRITVSLANTLPRFSENIANVQKQAAATAKSARATARSVDKQEKELTHWEQVVTYQGLALDGSGVNTLYESGISLDATGGVKIYSLSEGLQALYSAIQVNAGEILAQSQKISLVVTDGAIDAGSIILALNKKADGSATSTTEITSDIINLNGYVTATQLDAVEARIDHITSDTITASTKVSAATGKFNDLWVESPGQNGATNTRKVNNAINGITLSGPVNDVYTLTAERLDGSTVTIGNFNRAATSDTTLTGGWSGGDKFTVSASPQNKEYWTTISQGTTTWSGSTADVPIMAIDSTSGNNSYATGFVVHVNCSSITGTITNISGTALAANQIMDTNIPITASGTNLTDYPESAALETGTYTVGSITRHCVNLILDSTVIGRINTESVYEAGKNSVNVSKATWGTGNNAGKINFTPSSGTGSSAAVTLDFVIPANTSSGTAAVSIVDKASPGSTSVPLSTGLTKNLVLTCGDDYAVLKDGNTTVARVANNKSVPAATANVEKVTPWSNGAISFRPSTGTGSSAAVTLDFVIPANTSSGTAAVSIVDKASPGSTSVPLSTGLTKNLVLTCGDDYAVLKDGNTTVARVANTKSGDAGGIASISPAGWTYNSGYKNTVTATPNSGTAASTTVTLPTILVRPALGTSSSGTVNAYGPTVSGSDYAVSNGTTIYLKSDKDYIYITKNSGTPTSSGSGANVVARITNPAKNVTATISRLASCSFDPDEETAYQDVLFTLSNGKTVTLHEDFSDIYQAGLHGNAIDTTVEYEADFKLNGETVNIQDEGLSLDLSDIYLQGVSDATPAETKTYTYSSSGGLVDIYNFMPILQDGFFVLNTKVAFYPNTEVEVLNTLSGYKQVSYNGSKYWVLPDNLAERSYNPGPHPNWGRTGIKDLNVYATSIILENVIHTGNAPTLNVYLDPEATVSSNTGNYSSLKTGQNVYDSYVANADPSTYLRTMAGHSLYYGRHEDSDYSGDIYHKAIFTISYSDNTEETAIVEFRSWNRTAEAVVYDYYGTVDASSGSTVNMRQSMSSSASVVAAVPIGSTVRCKYNPNGYNGRSADGVSKDWMPVQYGDLSGYMMAKYIVGTKAYEEAHTKNISSISNISIAHNVSSLGNITVSICDQTRSGGRSYTATYVNSTSWNLPPDANGYRATTTAVSTYLKNNINGGRYAAHPGATYHSTLPVRVRMKVTYSNGDSETVCVEVNSFPYS